MSIEMNASTEDLILMDKIAERALKRKKLKILTSKLFLMMDLTAVHCNWRRLKLEEFLRAEDSDFFHDIVGIMRYLDRETGKLSNKFSPRFSL